MALLEGEEDEILPPLGEVPSRKEGDGGRVEKPVERREPPFPIGWGEGVGGEGKPPKRTKAEDPPPAPGGRWTRSGRRGRTEDPPQKRPPHHTRRMSRTIGLH